MDDSISRQAAIDAFEKVAELHPWKVPGNRDSYNQYNEAWQDALDRAEGAIFNLPSAQPEQLERCPIYDGVCGYPSDQCYDCPRHHGAQPEQRYTKEELRVFAHGISLSLLSKRSAQHWQYDENTATEIKFLERLYEKVGADIRGEEV